MTKKVSKALPPGAGPFTRGYWSFVFGEGPEPPHKTYHDDEYREEWARGYEKARLDQLRRKSQTRGGIDEIQTSNR